MVTVSADSPKLFAAGEKTRALTLRWCEIAVDSHTGVTVDSPIYRAVTEGRDPGPGYSSCADLAHWLLFRMGVRSGWINRSEHHGWAAGVNVSRLAFGAVSRKPNGLRPLLRGDIGIIWNHSQGLDAHVFVCDDWDGVARRCHAWDYGQAALKPESWTRYMLEGSRTVKALATIPEGWRVGSRQLQRVVPLLETIEHCRSRGELVEPDDPDEWLSRVLGKQDTIPAPPPGSR